MPEIEVSIRCPETLPDLECIMLVHATRFRVSLNVSASRAASAPGRISSQYSPGADAHRLAKPLKVCRLLWGVVIWLFASMATADDAATKVFEQRLLPIFQ